MNYNWTYLRTFDSDFDDVVCAAQVVCCRTAVVSSITFNHIRNPESFLEVLKRHSAAGQLSSILLPGNIWSGPVIEEIEDICFCMTISAQ